MAANPQHFLTPEEYLELERASGEKHEYFDGEMILMSGGSPRHNSIIFNLVTAFGIQLKGKPCRGFGSDQRVLIDESGLYTYPDLSIVCGEPVIVHKDNLANPTLIAEVLSPSTEDYDKGKKFDQYRKIASLKDYLLIAQDRPHIIHHQRDGAGWRMQEYESANDEIVLHSVSCRLNIADIYDKISF